MREQQTAEQLRLELSKALAAKALLEQEKSDVLAVNESLTKEIEKLYNQIKMCNCGKKRNSLTTSITSNELASYNFTLDGQKYGFNFFKLQYNQQTITAVDVCASLELQQQLVSSGSGMIKKII